MIFTQDFEKYGQKFKVKMLSQQEVESLGETKEEAMYELISSIVLNEKSEKVFKTGADVKASLPPRVMEEIINLSAGIEKKSV